MKLKCLMLAAIAVTTMLPAAEFTLASGGKTDYKIVIAANPAQVEQYKSGKTGLLGFFVGNVMKATGGKANPAVVNEILQKKLA